MVPVAGVSIETNLYLGNHVWVFELGTDIARRSKGFDERLFSHLIEWARTEGCRKIALSSGRQRDDAHRFYEASGCMERASYVFAKEID